MAQDYKTVGRRKKKKSRRKKRKPMPGWLWLSGGLALGLAIAAVIYFIVLPARPVVVSTEVTASQPAEQTSARQAAKASAATNNQPRFDFYTLLPKMEVVIPDSVIEEVNKILPKPDDNLAYILQIGSFRNAADAETRKAQLALIGLEASIQTVVINDADTWHRVRLGPFVKMAELKPVRSQLKRHDIQFMLLKIKL